MIGRNKEPDKPTCESGGGLEGEVVGSDGRECEGQETEESHRDVKAPQELMGPGMSQGTQTAVFRGILSSSLLSPSLSCLCSLLFSFSLSHDDYCSPRVYMTFLQLSQYLSFPSPDISRKESNWVSSSFLTRPQVTGLPMVELFPLRVHSSQTGRCQSIAALETSVTSWACPVPLKQVSQDTVGPGFMTPSIAVH